MAGDILKEGRKEGERVKGFYSSRIWIDIAYPYVFPMDVEILVRVYVYVCV